MTPEPEQAQKIESLADAFADADAAVDAAVDAVSAAAAAAKSARKRLRPTQQPRRATMTPEQAEWQRTFKWSSCEPAPEVLPDGVRVSASNFYELMLRHLIGGTITEVGESDDDFLRFTVKLPSGSIRTCEISQDEEGNGPGFLFGLPNPYDVYRDVRDK